MAQHLNHDKHTGTLDSGEVANLLRTMQAAQFKKSDKIVEQDTAFKPRSLVDIAFAAEERRKQAKAKIDAETAQKAAEAAAKVAAAEAATPAEQQAQPAQPDDAASAEQPDTDQSQPDQPEQLGQPETVPSEPATITQTEHDEMLAALRQELETQAQTEMQALEARLSEEHYHRGFEAGQEAARTAEPTEEELAHQAHQEAEKQDIIQRFTAAIDAAAKMESVDVSEIQQAIEFAVKRLASERAGYAITDNPEGLVTRIASLADNISSQARIMDVYLNPEDKLAVEKWLDTDATDHEWSLHSAAEQLSGDIRIVVGGIELTDLLEADELPEGYVAPQQSARPKAEEPAPDSAPQPELEAQIDELETAAPEAVEPEPVAQKAAEPKPVEPEPSQPEADYPEEQETSDDTRHAEGVEPEDGSSEDANSEDGNSENNQPEMAQPQSVPSMPAEQQAQPDMGAVAIFAPPASEGEGEFGFPPQPDMLDSGHVAETEEMAFAPPASEGEGEFGFPMGGRPTPSDDEAS